MKIIYSHPSIPPKGIELATEYELTIKGNKAIVSRNGFSKEFTKYQAETLFKPVKEIKDK